MTAEALAPLGSKGRLWVAAATLAASLIAFPVLAQDTGAIPGATVESLLALGRQLSPMLRAAALDTAAAAAKAAGAAALDDPTVSDNYQYYKNPGVFSGHALMVTQAFPLWGKRDLRREAALAELDAARGREQAARDELDEKIKVAFAQYWLANQALDVNRAVMELADSMRRAATARYSTGRGDQASVIQAEGEATGASIERVRLDGDRAASRSILNALIARPQDAPLAEPTRLRAAPGSELPMSALMERAHAGNPTIAATNAEVSAARTRSALADKAWYPDLTIGAGPLIQTNNRPPGMAATIGFNIPLPWGRAASEQQAAAAQLGAAKHRQEAALLDLQSVLGEQVARLNAARRTVALLSGEAIPTAQATLKAIGVAYAQGRGELAPALDAQHRVHDFELKLLQARLDEQVALAAIERLIGGDL